MKHGRWMFCSANRVKGKAHFVYPEGGGRGTAKCKTRYVNWVHLFRPRKGYNENVGAYGLNVYCKACVRLTWGR